MPPPKEKKQHSFVSHTFSKPNFIIHNPQRGDIVLQSTIMDFEHYHERNRLFRSYTDSILKLASPQLSDLKIFHDGVPYAKLFNRSVIIDNSISFNE